MNNTVAPAGPAPIISGPPFTLEIMIGLLALILALAGVVVGVAQYLQARAARRRQSDTESGTELSIVQSHRSDINSVRSGPSVDTALNLAADVPSHRSDISFVRSGPGVDTAADTAANTSSPSVINTAGFQST